MKIKQFKNKTFHIIQNGMFCSLFRIYEASPDYKNLS